MVEPGLRGMSPPASRRASIPVALDERQARVDLAACYRLVAMEGWADLFSTHISARVPGSHEHFLINPYGMLFDEITASSLIKIDFEGRKVEASERPVNVAGFVIHSAIHRARPDAVCVIHTHTTAGCAVASQKQGLLPLNQHALVILDDVACHDFEGPATRIGERERLATDLGNKKILILRHHGLLTVGASVAEAFMTMYRAERACRMQVAFQQAGAEHYPIEDEVARWSRDEGTRVFGPGGQSHASPREWTSLLRRLDRADRSFRD